MRIELLKDVLHTKIGEKSKGIIEILETNKNVNEFIIAKKLGLTINQTRNLLYKLLEEGLVMVTRKRNKKKGGWYDHFWTLNLNKCISKLCETLTKKIGETEELLHKKKKERFYFCEICQIELNEEQSLIQEYACAECGQILTLKDNTKEAAVLEKELIKLKKILEEAKIELESLSQKENKTRERKAKREDKKKKKEKEEKKKIAKAKKGKLTKKTPKKLVNKKK